VSGVTDGTSSYLSVTANDTGHPIGGSPAQALALAFTPAGTPAGQAPAYAEIDPARNATFELDGLSFTRQSNTVSDALPGVTLTFKKEGGAAEDLVVANDPDATRARLQRFVDAYDAVMSVVQRQLSPAEGSDRNASLQGDAAIRGLQRRLQSLVVTQVTGVGAFSTLADLGVKTARDGSLSIDPTTLSRAVARDPGAVNALFSRASTGISAAAADLVTSYTRAGDGVLVARQKGLGDTIAALDRQAETLSARIEAFRTNILKRFASMEEAVSGYKSIGEFLTRQTAQTKG